MNVNWVICAINKQMAKGSFVMQFPWKNFPSLNLTSWCNAVIILLILSTDLKYIAKTWVASRQVLTQQRCFVLWFSSSSNSMQLVIAIVCRVRGVFINHVTWKMFQGLLLVIMLHNWAKLLQFHTQRRYTCWVTFCSFSAS